MHQKLERLLKNKKYKLAIARSNNNSLIYVDDLKSWEEDTQCGEYEESKDATYKMIIVMVEGCGIEIEKEYNCIGKYYGLKPILRDSFNSKNQIYAGATIGDLYAFMQGIRGTSGLYVPYSYIEGKRVLKRKDLKLCYIEDGIAYFTNNPEQWGDDWNDAPYQHNAGTPYQEEGFELVKVGFYAGYNYSEPWEYFHSKCFSVEQINCKFVPWLTPSNVKMPPIFAGESIKEFTKKIEDVSGYMLYGIKFENYNY